MPQPDDFTATASPTPATIDATTDDASHATHTTRWIPVAQAAQIEGVSARAIQRRCQKDKYRHRRVQTPQGERIEVDADSLINRATVATMPHDARNNSGRDDSDQQRDARDDEGIEHRANIPIEVSAAPKTSDRAQTNHEIELLRVQLDNARAEAAREREFSQLLKSQLEDANRNAAELRASLREALRAMPKQLTQGTPTEAATPPEASGAPQISSADKVSSETSEAVKSAPRRKAHPLQRALFRFFGRR